LKTPKLSALGFGCKIVNWQPGDTLTPTSVAGVGTKIIPNRPCAAGAGAGAAEGQVRDRRQGNNSLVFTFCPAPVVENLFAAYVTPGQPNKPEKPTNQPVKPTISPTAHPPNRPSAHTQPIQMVGKWACPLGRATHVTGQWRRCRRLTLFGLDFIHLHMHAYDEIYLFDSRPFSSRFFVGFSWL